MKPADKKPTLVKSDPVHGDEYEHEAYGMVSYTHRSGRTHLVGSELEHHQAICLTIETATRNRNLNSDRFYGRKLVAQIEMSAQQWATFIASPNSSGVPCTLRYRPEEGAKLMECAGVEYESGHLKAKNELKEYGKEIIAGRKQRRLL